MTQTMPTDAQGRTAGGPEQSPHAEPQGGGINRKLNWLRAGVLGANDGIVSVAGIVVGVAGADVGRGAIGLAGLAGLVAGALSMAAGEYVSVSTQRDTEQALIEKEKRELAEMPDEELAELTELYRQKGLSDELASQVAQELTAKDALQAHLDAELRIDTEDLSSPVTAALASALSFTVGALLPLLMIVLSPEAVRIPITFVAVLIALIITGAVSARLGGARPLRAILRNVLGGAAAMAITYLIGHLVGTL
jgi:VIT1/CCC1 family predicted Fe2+/Mn2+ transporter